MIIQHREEDMANYVAAVKNNEIVDGNTAITSTRTNKLGTSNLDKDAFLQLLVCQMQNQDPLNPSTDTEFVSQLATFSQLEQLQNLSSTSEKSQAFSLVGKEVVLTTEDSSGATKYVTGTVDFINVTGNTVKLSVDGALYDQDQIYSVLDSNYVIDQNRPNVDTAVTYSFDAEKPDNFTFEVNLGSKDTVANQVAIVINNQIVDDKYITLDGKKLTISKELMSQLPNGEYKPTVIFNDSLYTTITDKVTLKVVNSKNTSMPNLKAPEENTKDSNPSDTNKDDKEV